jgi:hypothetical protein
VPLDRRTIATFLGLAFAISWTTAGLLYLFDVDLNCRTCFAYALAPV